MLVTIPKSLDGLNHSEKYILNKLKALYILEPNLTFLYLEPKIDNLNPDFILLDPKRGVVILEVKAWSIDFIYSVSDKTIKTKTQEFENPLSKARRYFNTLKNLFKRDKSLIDNKGGLKFELESKVIFTQLLKSDVKAFEAQFNHYPARAIYKEELRDLTFEKIFNNPKEIESSLIDKIRAIISPEIVLKREDSTITLDYEQERFAKSLPIGHYMINGVPGSGKSVTLIARAKYLAKQNPNWRVLVVVYNRLLRSNVEKLLKGSNVEIKTFHQLALSVSKLPPNFVKNSDEFWRSELPNLAIKRAKPTFDAILIDEYQDFFKSWFELILKLLKPFKVEDRDYFNLFLAGDRLQSIYHPKEINYKRDIGLDMRGRSKLLKLSYRVSPQSLNLALKVLMRKEEYKKEVESFYEGVDSIKFNSQKSSDAVELLEGDYTLVAKRVLELLKDYKLEEILILSLKRVNLNLLKSRFPSNISKDIYISKEFKKGKMLFSSLHSSKGIEAKVVILLDVDMVEDRKLFYVGATRATNKLILHSFDFEAGDISKEIVEFLKE